LSRADDSRAWLAGATALSCYWLPALATVWPGVRPLLGIADRLADARSVGLTFDDGPHPEGTPAVLEALAQAGVPGTFFLVGEHVARRPALAAEIAAAGHGIGLHCYRHRNLLRLAPRQLRDDLGRAEAAIADATGVAPRLYRPPYGVFSAAALLLARRRGWKPLLWTRWGRDWEPQATPASIVARLTARVRGGDVLLLHDADFYSVPGSWRRTADALPRLLGELEERELRPQLC
jgi:peptidoglycan/xylan/chitin deacetylase (PgdA/CDA1 family)